MSNAMAVTVPVNTAIARTQPLGYVSKRDGEFHETGTRAYFGSAKACGPVSELRKLHRAAGKTAKEARRAVNEALSNGEGSFRYVQLAAWTEKQRLAGKVPVFCDEREKSSTVRFEAIPEASASRATKGKLAAAVAEVAELKAKLALALAHQPRV